MIESMIGDEKRTGYVFIEGPPMRGRDLTQTKPVRDVPNVQALSSVQIVQSLRFVKDEGRTSSLFFILRRSPFCMARMRLVSGYAFHALK